MIHVQDPPYGAKVTYTIEKCGTGWESPPLAPWLDKAVAEASLNAFNKPHCYTGEGYVAVSGCLLLRAVLGV